MREQVIPKGARGTRAAAQPKGFVQRPARRDGSGKNTWNISPRALFGYVPTALRFVLALLAIVTLVVGYRVAASASLFQVRGIDVTGASRVSADEISGLTRRAAAKTGVWRADLSAISAELERLPGVRRAVVSRVLPDRLRVRVTERQPVAVVHTSAGHFFWVDEDGVALGEMKPSDTVPSFFIRGWNEDGTGDARTENGERVQKYLEVVREWNTLGLSERVSEVNLNDLQDVRAQLAGNDSQIEVRLGGQDLGARLKQLLEALDQYKQTPRGALITYLDMQNGRIVIGTSSGSKVSAPNENGTESNDSAPTPSPAANKKPGTANANTNATSNGTGSKPDRAKPQTEPVNATRTRLR